MEAIYVLSDPDAVKAGKYKVGITTRNQKYLLRDYRRSRPEVELHFFAICENSRTIEAQILEHFQEHRVPHETGKPSEWLHIDLKILLSYIHEKVPVITQDKGKEKIIQVSQAPLGYPVSEFINNECALSWNYYESCQTLYNEYLLKVPKGAQKLKFLNFCNNMLKVVSTHHQVHTDQIKNKQQKHMYYRGIVLKKNESLMKSSPWCVIL